MSVETNTKTLEPEYGELLTSIDLGARVLGILPDSIRDYSGQKTALFRSESQVFRAIGAQAEIDVQLLTPPETKRATQTERADVIVLPIVVAAAGTVIGNVLTPYIQGLIARWDKSGNRRPDIVYRRAKWGADGSVERVDITGDAESILKILDEESSSDN